MPIMKLAAIYNVWDGVELLRGSVKQIYSEIDELIIVWSPFSNTGDDSYNPIDDIATALKGYNYNLIKYVPILTDTPAKSETTKRQLGIDLAKELQCTHFLCMDCDEYYKDFTAAKQQYILSGCLGSVCMVRTYIRSPKYMCNAPDGYFVPFIHALFDSTVTGVWNYPFYVDPTRRINQVNVAKLNVEMHHFSYVRKDIYRKCFNSTAANNIKNGTIVDDYHFLNSDELAAGYYVKDWDRKIVVVDNYFGINI